jgi:molybdopterin synthase sulfur carrier subunit
MVADLKVEVRLFANLRELAKTKAVVEDVKSRTSVGDVLKKICERFGAKFREQIIDKRGQPNENIKVLLNGRNIVFLQSTATKLKDGDVIAIFPPVGGGSWSS